MYMVSCKQLRTKNLFQLIVGFWLLISVIARSCYLTRYLTCQGSSLLTEYGRGYLHTFMLVIVWQLFTALTQCLRNEIFGRETLDSGLASPAQAPLSPQNTPLRLDQLQSVLKGKIMHTETGFLKCSRVWQGHGPSSIPETGLKFPATNPSSPM